MRLVVKHNGGEDIRSVRIILSAIVQVVGEAKAEYDSKRSRTNRPDQTAEPAAEAVAPTEPAAAPAA